MSQLEYEVILVDGGYFMSPVLPRIDEGTGDLVAQIPGKTPLACFPQSLWIGMRKVPVHDPVPVQDQSVRPAHAADPAPTMVLGDPAEVQSVAQGTVL